MSDATIFYILAGILAGLAVTVSYIGINFQAPDAFYAPPRFVRVVHRRSFVHVLSTAKTLAPKSL